MRKLIKSISALTLALSAGMAGGVTPPCTADVLPLYAYEIATTCALYYTGFTGVVDITAANMKTCVGQFTTTSGAYGHEMYIEFTPTVGFCAASILAYAAAVYTAGSSNCGSAPTGFTLWESTLPNGLAETAACTSDLSASLLTFEGTNGFDIRLNSRVACPTGLTSTYYENAYEIMTTCALFDTVNMPDLAHVTEANMLACVIQFTSVNPGDYGYDMSTLLTPTGVALPDCAIAMVNYARELVADRPNRASCGDKPSGYALWETDLPASLLEEDCFGVISNGLESFFATSDFDIRDTVWPTACLVEDLPEFSYEIVTMCVLFDDIAIDQFSDISFTTFVTCAQNFEYELPGNMGYELNMTMTDMFFYQVADPSYTFDCGVAMLNYAKRLYLRGPPDGACGSAPVATPWLVGQPRWEEADTLGLWLQTCYNTHTAFGFLNSLLVEFSDDNSFSLTDAPSTCEDPGSEAFEIISTCVLFLFDDPNVVLPQSVPLLIPRFIDITAANLTLCAGLFDNANFLTINYNPYPYSDEVLAALNDDTGCAFAMVRYGKKIFGQRENRATCGLNPYIFGFEGLYSITLDQFVPAGIASRSDACIGALTMGLDHYELINGYSMGPVICTPEKMPANAFDIVTTCATFDTTNMPYEGPDAVPVTVWGLLACIEDYFASDVPGDYAYELKIHLTSSSYGGCAAELVWFGNEIHGYNSDCGAQPTGSPWDLDSSIFDQNSDCMEDIAGGLSDFFADTGFDIREPKSIVCSPEEMPDNTFEIVTNCLMFGGLTNDALTNYADLTSQTLGDCVEQFAHSEIGDYGKELYDLLRFSTERTSCGLAAALDYARILLINSADEIPYNNNCGTISPSTAPWTSSDVWYGVANGDLTACYSDLSFVLQLFFNKFGFDIREITANPQTCTQYTSGDAFQQALTWLNNTSSPDPGEPVEFYSYISGTNFGGWLYGIGDSSVGEIFIENADCQIALLNFMRHVFNKMPLTGTGQLNMVASTKDIYFSNYFEQASFWSALSSDLEAFMKANTVDLISLFEYVHLGLSNQCLPGALPIHAFEIVSTCALFGNFNLFTEMSMENLIACVAQFTSAVPGDYAYDLLESLTLSDTCQSEECLPDNCSEAPFCPPVDCSYSLLEYARNVYTYRSERASCGVTPWGTTLWETQLPSGIAQGLPACMNVVTPSLLVFEARTSFSARPDTCWAADIPANAYAAAVTCGLFDTTDLLIDTPVTTDSLLACFSSNFAHTDDVDFAYGLVNMFTNDTLSACAASIVTFTNDVLAVRVATGATCGTAPTLADWSEDLPSGLFTDACFSSLAVPIENYWTSQNELDIRYAEFGACLLSDLQHFYNQSPYFSLNAFAIASTCALFDDQNLASFIDISPSNILKCVDRFPHEATADFGTGMHDMFGNSDTACSIALLNYVKRAFRYRGTTDCGTPVPPTTTLNAWSEGYVPTEISSQDSTCLGNVLTVALEGFYSENNQIDIRAGDFGACTFSQLDGINAYEIATVCALFDTFNLPDFASVTYANFQACLAQFGILDADFGYDLGILFGEATESNCSHSLLDYVRSLIDQRGDAEICGALPQIELVPWVYDLVPTPIEDQHWECLGLLSSSLNLFYEANGWDLRSATEYHTCDAAKVNLFESKYFTVELIRECQLRTVVPANFEDCVGNSQLSDVCTDCYEALWVALQGVSFGISMCTEASVYTEECALSLWDNGSGPLEAFRLCSGGSEIAFTARPVCNPSDADLEPFVLPIRFAQNFRFQEFYRHDADLVQDALSKVYGMDTFALSPCWECYSAFYFQMATFLRSDKMMEMCGDGADYLGVLARNVPDYSYRVDLCVSFLHEAENPLSNFVKCAKFDLTIPMHELDVPMCNANDASVIDAPDLSLVPLIECLVGLDNVDIRIDEFLQPIADGGCVGAFREATPNLINSSSEEGPTLSDPCTSCFQSAQIKIFDILLTPGGRTACQNPYSADCAQALDAPIRQFGCCAQMGMDLTLESVIACDDNVVFVSAEKKALAVQQAISFAMVASYERVAAYENFDTNVHNPISGKNLTCYPCFEGFIDRLIAIPSEGQTICLADPTSAGCGMYAYDAIEYFEACSGWQVEWTQAVSQDAPVASCLADWSKVNPIYTFHAPILELVLDKLPVPTSFNVYAEGGPFDCEVCFTQYYNDVTDLLTNNVATAMACVDPFSAICLTLLAAPGGPFERFTYCTNGQTLSTASPYTCTSDVLTTIFVPNGLGETIIADIALGQSSEVAALYALDVTLSAAIADNVLSASTFTCRTCFVNLVASVSSMSVLDKTTCIDNFTSLECIVEAAPALKAFEACAGAPFDIAPPPPAIATTNTQDQTVTAETPVTNAATTAATTTANPASSKSANAMITLASLLVLAAF